MTAVTTKNVANISYSRVKFGLVMVGIAGCLLSLGLAYQFQGIWQSPTATIFGDRGDGLFNLWVMETNIKSWSQGDLIGMFNGKIFYPEHQWSKLFSDTLILPTLIYWPLKLLLGHPFSGYGATFLVLVVLSYGVHLAAFYAVYALEKPAIKDQCPRWLAAILLPLLAYLATFSVSKGFSFAHFQNMSSFWSVLVVVGGYGFVKQPGQFWLWLCALGLILVSYSTQYFSVTACLVVMALIAMHLGRFGVRHCFYIVKSNSNLVMLTFLALLPLAWFYGKVVLGHGLESKPMGISYFMFFTPIHFSVAFEWAQKWGIPLRGVVHEKPAYIGYGLLMTILIVLLSRRREYHCYWQSVKNFVRTPLFWVIIAYSVLYHVSKGRDLIQPLAMSCLYFGLVLYLGRLMIKTVKPEHLGLVFLVLVLGVYYGTAFGPNSYAPIGSVNPSLWGLMEILMPGYSHMRAVGRMVTIGYVVILMLVLMGVLRLFAKAGPVTIALVMALLGLNGVEHMIKFAGTPLELEELTPRPDETAFFVDHKGPILVWPTQNVEVTTRAMWYFNRLDRTIVNGHSGRSTKLFETIQRYPDKPQHQMGLARQVGVKWGVLFKDQADSFHRLPGPSLFENDRIQVVALN